MPTHEQGSILSRRTAIALAGGTAAAAALAPGGLVGRAEAHGQHRGERPGGSWLHMALSQTSILDDATLSFLLEHHEGVGLRAPLHAIDGPAERFDYPAVVQRIKTIKPVPVLLYTFGAMFLANVGSGTGRIDQDVFEGYQDLGDLLMPEWPQGNNGRQYYGDPRNPAFRDWAVQRISTWVTDMGCDGAFVDLAWIYPRFAPLSPEATIAYRDGMQALLSEIRDAVGFVMMNGLQPDEIRMGRPGVPDEPGLLDEQKEGLPYVSGAMIEYFGWEPNARQGRGPVPVNLVPYLPIPSEFPDSTLMFSGRGLRTYEDYEADYLRQRYDYVAYLLAAGGNSYFKYNATFQQPGGDVQRTGHEAVFRDGLIDIGSPLEEYQENDGLYTRRFTDGLVAWNPELGGTGEPRSLRLPRPMFDPEGRRYHRSVSVDPGLGLLLLERPHRPRPTSRIDLGEAEAPGGDWDLAERRHRYLHLDRTPTAREHEHDLMLDPIRSLTCPLGITVQMRTADPDARLDIVVEVDDVAAEHNRIVVRVGTQAAPLGTQPIPVLPNAFRVRGRGGYRDRPGFTADMAIDPDGHWQNVRIDIPRILSAAGGQYTPWRLVHMRAIGTMDLRQIRLGHPTAGR